MANAETIDQMTLENLVQAGAIRGATVVGQPGGWGLVVKFGMSEKALAAKRGAVRTWRKLETLVLFLKGIGIVQFATDASNYSPESSLLPSAKRPDAAERMRRAHEAAAYDQWIRDQVQESLADPRPNVSHAQAMSEVQAVIDAVRVKHA